MSNHYHIVLHINKPECEKATALSIAKRWHLLFKGTDVSTKFIQGEHIESYEREQLDTLIDLWRQRLYSISWFMKVLNEKIAREANKEDDCTGHFWRVSRKPVKAGNAVVEMGVGPPKPLFRKRLQTTFCCCI